eukprot:scaffold80755_cov61-Phaeocystis_antarctica.AAC.8
MSWSGRPGGECMAGACLGEMGCSRRRAVWGRESPRKTCNDPATTPQTCPPDRRGELTNHPTAIRR